MLVELSRQERANMVRDEIRMRANLTVQNFVEFCKKVKELRDEKLYIELGYETLEECTKAEFNFGQRQAYSYISVVENLKAEYIESNINLGISKLSLLASATWEEREKLEESGEDLESMSTKELADALAKIERMKEQMSFLEDTNTNLREQLDEKDSALKHFEDTDKMSDDELESELEGALKKEREKIRAELEKEFKQKSEADNEAKAKALAESDKIKAEKKNIEKQAKETEKAKAEAESRVKELEQELELEKKQIKVDEETAKKYEAEKAEREKLEKQLKVSSDPVMTKFKFMLSKFRDDFNDMVKYTVGQENADKMLNALKQVTQSFFKEG